MADINFSSYFYGDEAMHFTYFHIPCQLITHPRFKHLSTDAQFHTVKTGVLLPAGTCAAGKAPFCFEYWRLPMLWYKMICSL